MKIVNLQTFLTLPAGTLFSKYGRVSFENLCIKEENSGNIDFYYQTINDAIDSTSSGQLVDQCFQAEETGSNLEMDFDASSRDGLFNKEQLFAVWDRVDVEKLITRLQQALVDSAQG